MSERGWELERFGKVEERARGNVVLCDYDFRKIPRVRPMLAVLRMVGLTPVSLRSDRTRRGWHIVIELRETLTPAETVALQAVLGSDSRRECLNLMRVRAMRVHGVPEYFRSRWNLLYERKVEE